MRIVERAASVLEVMRHTVERDDPRLVRGFLGPDGSVEWTPYARLLRQSFAYAARLREAGVRPGDVALLLGLGGRSQATAYFAALSAGATPMTLPSLKVLSGQRQHLLSSVQDWVGIFGARTVVVSDGATAAFLAEQNLEPRAARLLVAPSSAELAAFPEQRAPALDDVRPDDLCHFQATSASTGRPRAVAITHRNVLVNVEGIRVASRAGQDERVCTWLPMYHDMGLIGTELFSLCHQYPLVSMTPFEFLKRPLRWLQTMSEQRCTLSPAPNFAYEYVAEAVSAEDVAGLDLSSWKVAYNGAEPIRRRSMELFLERLRPAGFAPGTMCPCYGLAEATLAVTMTDEARSPRALTIDPWGLSIGKTIELFDEGELSPSRSRGVVVYSVGKPLPNVRVEIRDELNRVVGRDLVLGEIAVQGPSVSAGYFSGPQERVLFVPELRTGDLGFWRAGELYVVERLKNVVIHNGRNYCASIIEDQLGAALGISSARIAVFESSISSDRTEVVAMVELHAKADVKKWPARLSESEIDLPVARLCIVPKRAIPRTTSGKKRHFLCRSMLREGAITPVSEIQLR